MGDQAHPGVDPQRIAWSGVVTDSHYGFVRVRAAVPGPSEVLEYLFDVNLAGQRLHPGNDRARALLEQLRLASAEQSD